MSLDHPHRRRNALTGDWVLVSPHRMKRPWQGKQETPARDTRPAYDPKCYLCPGNERAGGQKNPAYTGSRRLPRLQARNRRCTRLRSAASGCGES